MNIKQSLTVTVLIACVILTVVGALGMVLSFLYMASADPRDITAGTSGFIAGTAFICASLVAAAIVSLQSHCVENHRPKAADD